MSINLLIQQLENWITIRKTNLTIWSTLAIYLIVSFQGCIERASGKVGVGETLPGLDVLRVRPQHWLEAEDGSTWILTRQVVDTEP